MSMVLKAFKIWWHRTHGGPVESLRTSSLLKRNPGGPETWSALRIADQTLDEDQCSREQGSHIPLPTCRGCDFSQFLPLRQRPDVLIES